MNNHDLAFSSGWEVAKRGTELTLFFDPTFPPLFTLREEVEKDVPGFNALHPDDKARLIVDAAEGWAEYFAKEDV